MKKLFAKANDDGADTAEEGRAPVGIIQLGGNLADAEKPPEIRPGVYPAELHDVQIKTSGNSGNQYFACMFVIPQDRLAPDLQDFYPDGARMFWNRVIVPGQGDSRALWNLRKFVEALGLDSNTNQVDPNEWMGCKVRLRVRSGEYQGEKRAEIQAVEAGEPEAPKQTTRGAATPRAAAGGRRR